MVTSKTSYKKIKTISPDIGHERHVNGTVFLYSNIELEPHPFRLTEKLKFWAETTPDNIFIGQRDNAGIWRNLTYKETFNAVRCIAEALLKKDVSPTRPIAILSENSIEHALLALAALHIGIPYSPVSPAYSLKSTDFVKLKHVINLLTPGLIFVQNFKKYKKALAAVAKDVAVISMGRPSPDLNFTPFDDLCLATPTTKVEEAFSRITPSTIAKILFTSGSTGEPKGVINTHENISTNWQQITQTFPFLKEADLELIDWLPWNHTFGGNHNFGIALYNGGAIYLDDGDPTAKGIAATVANLKQRSPTIYFNVPKGFESLLPYFKEDQHLRQQFFSKLKMLFYAGASLPQRVWNAWEDLAVETIHEKIIISTGLGCTESCPSALFLTEAGGFAGWLGTPVPGLQLKLTPCNGKFEARYKGKNIFPGYWREPWLTAKAFDEEGFYCTGDALRFVDVNNIQKGLIFDGRLAEDFKLNTATWVHTSVLRSQLILAGKGLIHDAVITGHDREFIGAIIFPGIAYCKSLTGEQNLSYQQIIKHPAVKHKLREVLTELAVKSTGSSNLVQRGLFANFLLNMDSGEITDKGTINQKLVLLHHPETIQKMYSATIENEVIDVTRDG